MTSADQHGRDHAHQEPSGQPPAGEAAAPDHERNGMELQHALLRQAVDANPNLIFVKDRQGRFTLANKAVADIYGTTVADLIGRTDADFNVNASEVERFRRDDLEVMDARRERAIEEVVTDARGVEHVLHTVKRPIVGPDGRADHVLGVAVDVTERRRTENAYRFLADAGAELAASLDYEATLANVVRMAVPAIADWCAIDLLDESGELRRLAIMHENEAKLAASRELHGRTSPGLEFNYGARRVMSTGQPIFEKAVDEVTLKQLAMSDEHERMIRSLGLCSFMCVPLEARGRVLGAISLATAESGRIYTEDDLQLAVELARRAAIAVDNAMLHRAQQRSQRQYRALVEQVTDYAIFMVDSDGRATSWNEGVERVLGFEEDEFIGQSFRRLFTPEDLAVGVPEAELHAAADAGQASNDRWMVRRDGSRFWASGTTTAIRDDDSGEVIGFTKVMRDLTKQKLAEAELARHREQLEQLVAERTRDLEESHERLLRTDRMAAIGSLSAGLGHDIGNLLLPVQIRLESLEARLLAEDTNGRMSQEAERVASLEDIDAVRSAARHLQRLANGLRLLARDPEETAPQGVPRIPGLAGQAVSEAVPGILPGVGREAVELGAWWEEVEPLMKNALPRGVALEGSFAPNLPPVRMPRHSLTQAVFNIVQNAGDAMGPHGDGRVVVSARPAEKTDRLELTVADNGPGMTEEVKRRCFEPFFSTRTRGISTGLGLALVHGLVARAGGTIELDSHAGRGSRFTINLPAVVGSRVVRPEQRRVALLTLSDPRMRTYIASVLRSLGMEVAPPATRPTEEPSVEFAARPDPRLKLWVAEARLAREDVEEFLDAHPARRAVLLGNGDAADLQKSPAGERIETLSERPKTAEIWRALHAALQPAAPGNGKQRT